VAQVGGGKRLIRVADNGDGIPGDQVELAFERHSTSKLAVIEDLDTLGTLGFRGEALSAIAAVSRITMVTRARGEQAGTRLRVEGGQFVDREVVGAPQGTVVTVENLFYNVPARLKFLKTDATERRHVDDLVTRYAMAYPGVRFSVEQDGREVFHTTGGGDLREVLVSALGLSDADQMLELTETPAPRDDLSPIQVTGYAGVPGLHRSNRSNITLFVNGRWVQDSRLSYAVIQAYQTLLPTGRFPVAVVMLELPPTEVDVNVHPTKAEVRFRRADAAFSAVQRAVRRALVDQSPVQKVTISPTWGSPEWAARRERLTQVTSARMGQLDMPLPEAEPGRRRSQIGPEGEAAQQRPTRNLPMLRVVGQVGAMYVVAEGPGGLYLIDQHAAHERVLYEEFMAKRTDEPLSQNLLEAVNVELSPPEMALLEENWDALLGTGFAIEHVGGATFRIRAVPGILASGDPGDALRGVLSDIECGEMPAEAPAIARLIARVCKRAAIKGGQILSFEEMQALIRQLERCEAPRTCPHGRPTMLHITGEQLAKEFGRL
jgi:DNA mismatch repair protein MutL